MNDRTTQIHATAIALDGRAALILGPSGAGKSDLALRCILQGAWINATHRTATLVADDQVIVERQGDTVVARPPESIAGRIEVRGLGIVEMPHNPASNVSLAVALTRADAIERLPDPPPQHELLGLSIPLLRVAPFEASAHLKVMLALVRGLPSA